MDYVFTPRALQTCMAHAVSDDWFGAPAVPDDGSWQVLSISRPQGCLVFHREDETDSARIVLIDNDGNGIFGVLPAEARRVAAQRVHRAALEAQRPPMRLPWDWREFHEDNLTAFFAAPDHYGSYRWIMEMERQDGIWTTCFWQITTSDDPVLLKDYHPDRRRLKLLLDNWNDAHGEAVERFKSVPVPATTEALQNAIDLEAVSHAAVTQYRTYDQWLEILRGPQKKFVELSTDHSVKLRGPAGSGKTLALELKVLRELYHAREQGKNIRILFATHSWAMAAQVDEALHLLDQSGDLSSVEVLPLVAIAQDRLPKERSGAGFKLLGEDSLSGRQLQLEKISETIKDLRYGDWLAYRHRVSEAFRVRVEAPEESVERRSFVWDLMNEFASVLSANGILPGVNAERKYLSISRAPWMMPLENDVEKRFVLRVYGEYVAALKVDGLLTTDQLINDYHNFLETFVWNLRREEEGYDLIFVDELHLFGEQERLVLHYLTRSPDEYPRLFMALDPRQSPNEVYANFSMSNAHPVNSGEADKALGDIDSMDLITVHRFSPEVLRLVRHINRSYPALELGADWELDLESVDTDANHGEIPSLSHHTTISDEIAGVLDHAMRSAASNGIAQRTAIVLLDPLLLDTYVQAAGQAEGHLSVIRGRADLDQLRYTKKSVVLSAAEYVGGLQFHTVVCAGFVDTSMGRANLGYQLRRFLSLLYLAVSRSSGAVHLHVNDERGGIPSVLESALASGVVTRVNPR